MKLDSRAVKEFLSTISRIPLPMAVVLSVGVMCGWIPDFLQPDADFLALSLTMVCTLLNAFFLLYLTCTAALTRRRDLLPLWLYLLTVTAFPEIHAAWRLQVAVLMMTAAVSILLRAYREEDTAHDSFLVTSLIVIASLFVPQAVFAVPMVWLAYILLRAMRFRTFLASLISMATFAVYIALAVYVFHMDCPYASLSEWHGSMPSAGFWILLACHIAFLVTTAVRIDRDSTTQQALLILQFLFFLPTAAASLFFRQRDSLVRGICFVAYVLFLAGCYGAYYLF